MDPVMDVEVSQDDQDIKYSRLANFEIDKKIGKGQFSEVYRARCKHDSGIVALKKVQVTCMVNACDCFNACFVQTNSIKPHQTCMLCLLFFVCG